MFDFNIKVPNKGDRRKRGKDHYETTAEEILGLLANRHKDRQWVFYPELRYSTHIKDDKDQADSRVDAWAFNIWPSRRFARISYEIKISRHDFLREMKKDEKRKPGLDISNEFYYVIPDGCVDVNEIPEECGLIVVKFPKGKDYKILSRVKEAPWREPPPLAIDFWASVARRLNREEGLYEQ